MELVFTEEQEELRRAARAFLADHSASEQVRAAMASDLGFDPDTWKRIAAELGWTGVAIPEQYGGAGLGFVELVALLEVMGEALLCAPFLSSVCMAAPALLAAGECAATREWLPAIAEGRSIATLAVAEANGGFGAGDVATVARRSGDGFTLSGEKRFVLDGHCADLVLVAARREGSAGDAGVSLFAVPAASSGLERRALPTMDQTRRFADVSLRDVRVPAAALIGAEGQAWPMIQRAQDLAAIALAAEQVGGAQRCLDLSVAYAKERVQFGRPIGSFQAIKHKCADMMTAVESSRSAAYYAACVAQLMMSEDCREDPASLRLCASTSKAWCSEAYFRCAADALQIHGGVGFTWEYDVHLHLKRARSMEAFLGSPAWHRERVAAEIGL